MKKPIFPISCVFAVCLCLTVSVWWLDEAPVFAADGSGEPSSSSDVVEEAERDSVNLDLMKDERLLQVEQAYEAAVAAKAAEAEATSDAAEAERLQREVHQLKTEALIGGKEVMLDIALEQEDEEQIDLLQDDLDALYNPQSAQPAAGSAVRAHEDQAPPTVSQMKNPDDQ